MEEPLGEGTRRISVDLPTDLIEKFDELKREWGLRARGAVLKRLLEEILTNTDDPDNQSISFKDQSNDIKSELILNSSISENRPEYDENQSIVLVGKNDIKLQDTILKNNKEEEEIVTPKKGLGLSQPGGIDLPAFVHKRTNNLRESLGISSNKPYNESDRFMPRIDEEDVTSSIKSALHHWISIYGQKPGEKVVEAAMLWLARDIWPHIEGTEGCLFTWSAANRYMKNQCPSWEDSEPNFERVMVLAGMLEDPFAAKNLNERMPTLIRRFVNKFKRSRTVTSFETLESTMTVHGALKLLGLPTRSGSSITLNKIREAYKTVALRTHPDAGGSTEGMRRLNEAYQLLKELYRHQSI